MGLSRRSVFPPLLACFIADVRSRLVVMPQLTSDGFAPHIEAVGASFGLGVDYMMTVKN